VLAVSAYTRVTRCIFLVELSLYPDLCLVLIYRTTLLQTAMTASLPLALSTIFQKVLTVVPPMGVDAYVAAFTIVGDLLALLDSVFKAHVLKLVTCWRRLGAS
jgi:hypothetical protein